MQPIKIGLIGGSGLGAALHAREHGTPQYVNTPFGKPSGTIIETTWADVPVLVLSRHGNGHIYNPSAVPYRANVFALKMLGCTHVLASGAVGSLREEFRPRDVVVPDQTIDKTFRRPSTFFDSAAVHVDFAEPFCPVLRQILKDASADAVRARSSADDAASASASTMKVHHGGCYVAMEGPAFSTRAESLMHRLWGGDLIGMTAMPEAKLAREAELPYALIALVTDYDAWRQLKPTAPKQPAAASTTQATATTASAQITAGAPAPAVAPASDADQRSDLSLEIVANLKAASENAIALMQAAVERIAREPSLLDGCPASRALESAIWSDPSKLAPDDVARLRPLWGRYF